MTSVVRFAEKAQSVHILIGKMEFVSSSLERSQEMTLSLSMMKKMFVDTFQIKKFESVFMLRLTSQ
jgi:hypothetical protein